MVKPHDKLRDCVGFEWDEHNITKNWDRHDVTVTECEQVFFNRPLIVRRDADHSQTEARYYVLGRTDNGCLLFAAFTIRQNKIRIISARHDGRRKTELPAMKKTIPTFKSEVAERRFWQTHDTTDYVDWSAAENVVLPKLKPSTRSISIRLPEAMVEELKLLANKRDVPYQSLLKVFLAERIDEEFHTAK